MWRGSRRRHRYGLRFVRIAAFYLRRAMVQAMLKVLINPMTPIAEPDRASLSVFFDAKIGSRSETPFKSERPAITRLTSHNPVGRDIATKYNSALKKFLSAR